MNNIPNRRQRRLALKYQGILKNKSNLSYNSWTKFTSESIQSGIKLHEANRDNAETLIASFLTDKEVNLIDHWQEFGYNKKEINLLREAVANLTVKNKNTWHADKKVSIELFRNVAKSYRDRIHG